MGELPYVVWRGPNGRPVVYDHPLTEIREMTREEELEAINADLLAALQAVIFDICDYERINNLAPNPGRQDCWDSVTRAKAAIARAQGKG